MESKNCRLKITVRACICAYMRVYMANSHQDTRPRNTHLRKRAEHRQNKICYCWDIYTAIMKKVKKNLEIRKNRRIFVAVIKNKTTDGKDNNYARQP